MAQELFVSVIIPAKNAAKYITEAIASISGQLPAKSEILVVDGGSTDQTREIAQSANPKVRTMLEPEPGNTAALNLGIANAQGDYVAFLDADDLWTPDKLDLQLKALNTDPTLEACFGLMESFFSPELSLEERTKRQCPSGRQPAILAGAMLARKGIFQKYGSFDTAYLYTSFLEWFGRARRMGLSSKVVDAAVLRRRIHTTNVSITKRDETRSEYLRLTAAMARARTNSGGNAPL